MLFIIALALGALFVFLCKGPLKKYPYLFYGLAIVLTLISSLVNFTAAPSWINTYVIGLFNKGCLGTALFVIVMYTGALPQGAKLAGPLYKIRGELSITAAFLVLSHNIMYGKTYFKLLFTNPIQLPTVQLIAAIISVILVLLMTVLTVTSFPSIRKKMKAKNWKKLQRSAYAFYGLIYVHVMLINLYFAKLGLASARFNVFIYSLVFITYAALRVRKAKAHTVLCGSLAFLAIFLISLWGYTIKMPTVEPSKDNSNVVASSANTAAASSEALGSNSEASDTELSDTEGSNTEVSDTEGSNTDVSSTQNSNSEVSSSNASNDETDNTASSNNATASNSTENESTSSQPQTKARTYKADGTYTGSAYVSEYDYTVTVSVTISDDTISSVSFTTDDNGTNASYISMASVMGNRLKNAQGGSVNTVSGATYTSNAVISAFNEAIASAK